MLDNENSLEKWLAWLETAHPVEIDLGHTHIKQIADTLSLINFDIPVIMVAGTNGKGSTVATLEACYRAAGYMTGVYTSPHLLKFNERIRINSLPVAEQSIVNAFTTIKKVLGKQTLSYFEYTTLAALEIFKYAQLDILILEVGLGGRLDAVNIVEPDISVITTIDYDHQAWLGETRELIAQEKAGILRENKPVVVMETDVPMALTHKIEALSAQAYYYQKDYSAIQDGASWTWLDNDVKIDNLPINNIPMSNLATAIKVMNLLQGKLPIAIQAISTGLHEIYIPGRCQTLNTQPLIIADVAHNAESAEQLSQFIKTQINKKKIHVIFSALKDKDIKEIIAPMVLIAHDWHVAEIQHKRAAKIEVISSVIKEYSEKSCTIHSSLAKAYQEVLAKVENDDMIVVYGSFFTVSEILNEMQIKLYENLL